MGTNNYGMTFAGLNTRNVDIKQDADLVTVRVNYRFGGPVVARY
jgi:outer membrane immunogenic protein